MLEAARPVNSEISWIVYLGVILERFPSFRARTPAPDSSSHLVIQKPGLFFSREGPRSLDLGVKASRCVPHSVSEWKSLGGKPEQGKGEV